MPGKREKRGGDQRCLKPKRSKTALFHRKVAFFKPFSFTHSAKAQANSFALAFLSCAFCTVSPAECCFSAVLKAKQHWFIRIFKLSALRLWSKNVQNLCIPPRFLQIQTICLSHSAVSCVIC